MAPIRKSRKTTEKKRIYLLIELASIIVFTIPILILMDGMSVDWAEANKNTFTNGELLRYASMMFVGSVLLAAIIGLLICIIVRLIIGKDGKNGNATETVVVKEPKIRKKRELPSKTEVLYIAIAVLGLALSMASFLYCTGIEYVSFDRNIMTDEPYLEDLERSVADKAIDTFVSKEGISTKWGILIKLMLASESGEPLSLFSFAAPDKTLVLGILAILISAGQLKFGCGKMKLNIATIVIAVIAILLNCFLSPWIQLFGGAFYCAFLNGLILWVVGRVDMLKQIVEALIELFSLFASEEFRNQRYME